MRFPIVGIGASAGGIDAFKALLGALPDDTGMAFVFVLHLAPGHVSMLSHILSRETQMRVAEVHDEPEVEPNRVYVIPPNRAMVLRGGRLHLIPETSVPRHPVDTFFGSLAEDRGHLAVGVVLSGTATDGTLGLTAIKAVGGITFAQDASAQQDGMPRSAINAGCVDFVLPPRAIASEIVRLARHPYVTAPQQNGTQPQDLGDILQIIRRHFGVDFSLYKSNTLQRRIRRRMALHKLATPAEYAAHLSRNTEEVEALYQDILISVTNFFRHPETFEALKARILPKLLKGRTRQDPLRAWVLGCSSGEEAYSLAIVLSEHLADTHSSVPVALYATDLNSHAIERARVGVYPRSIADDVSPERLRRFFVEVDGGYRVSKSIRDMCIFARQNVLSDPPFSRIDLLSCRNVMIYMEAALQKKLLRTLHYALKPTGYLLLGPSETIGASHELFEPQDGKHKIFSKKVAARSDLAFPVTSYAPPQERRAARWGEVPKDVHAEFQREADRALLTRYVPAGVLVNGEHEVMQFRGNTGLYLAPAPGKASLNVLKMAREGLLVSLRTLLQKARKSDSSMHDADVRVKSNGGFRHVSLAVIPVRRGGSDERWFWVLFEDALRGEEHSGEHADVTPSEQRERQIAPREKVPARVLQEKEDQISRLTQELAATRDYLQSVIEQQEAANEELQSANEEVQSANEELQSINEELETSKEEIQSSNEELRTVNDELHNRNEELSRLNDDLNNLLASIDIAIVMVWQDLRIRRFTPLAEKHFNLIATDIGRPIGDIKLNLEVPDLPKLLAESIDNVVLREMDVRDRGGHWYLLRIRPYKTQENKIDGAVIALVDVDTIKANQEALERQGRLLDQTREAVFVRELDGEILFWNRGAELLYGHASSEAVGRNATELLDFDDARSKAVADALASAGQWEGELTHRAKDGRAIVVDSTQLAVRQGDRTVVLTANHDVTERKRLEESLHRRVEELAAADRHKNEFLATLAHELRNPLAPIRNAVEILRQPRATDEMRGKARDLIERQLRHVIRLVDDLLDTARINRGQVQLKLQPVDLQDVLRRAIDATRYVAEQHDHHLSIEVPEPPIRLNGDPARLQQVFANLLSNAMKFTPDGGEIGVRVEIAEEATGGEARGSGAGRWALVHVRDTGIGIAPDMLARVFELFSQADRSLARTQGGLGIGLSIVRSLVELHGGTVLALSEGEGRGSEFVVRLPIAADPRGSRGASGSGATAVGAAGSGGNGAGGNGAAGAGGDAAGGDAAGGDAAGADAGVSSRKSGPCRVLVVDDNRDIAESTALMLTLAGHVVKCATSGAEALDVASSFHPAVVLLDIGMPELDGYAVARRLRAGANGAGAVLIAVSGYGTSADRERTHDAGFDRHLIKPVDPAALQRVLEEVQPVRRA